MSTDEIFNKYLEYYSSEHAQDTVGSQHNEQTNVILKDNQDLIFSPSAMIESTQSSLIDKLAKIQIPVNIYDISMKIMKVFELLKKDMYYFTLDLTPIMPNVKAFQYVLQQMRMLRLYYDGLSEVGYIALPAGEHLGNSVKTILDSFGIDRGQY